MFCVQKKDWKATLRSVSKPPALPRMTDVLTLNLICAEVYQSLITHQSIPVFFF